MRSWAEHLRQHQRVTVSDQAAEERARAFHIGAELPVMSHFISAHMQGAPDAGETARQ